MGICSSCGRSVAATATAKLILEDGRLEEFPSPIRVSDISQRNPRFFICNADDIGFDDRVSAIDDDTELQLGQLYFELPIIWLDNPMKVEEMAILAVKASLALNKMADDNGRYKCWFWLKNVDHVQYKIKKPVEARPLVAIADNGGCSGELARRVGGGGGKGRKFSNKLSVILEE